MKLVLYILLGLFLFGCSSEPEIKEVEPVNEVESDAYPQLQKKAEGIFGMLPAVAEKSENPITDKKVALGKMLFFDKQLSKDNTISCNSCHNLAAYGVDNLQFSPGNDDGSLGGRNSPSVYNAAFHLAQFWDGRAVDVEEQAGMPILNPVEMAIPSEEFLVARLLKDAAYQKLFAEAFSDDAEPLTYSNIENAIGAFERTLITPSRFDDYIAGNSAVLTNQEKKGLETFISVGCITCHAGNLLGGTMYQKFGLVGNYWEHTGSENIDEGRFEVTQKESDKYVFKVASLRNIEKTGPYFHDGSVADLNEAVRIMGKLQLNKELDYKETAAITAFLKTLTGEIPEEFREE